MLPVFICTACGLTADDSGDVHTYRDDGWIVKNAPAKQQYEGVELSAAGMEKAAFMLLEMGHEVHAQRALMAAARYCFHSCACKREERVLASLAVQRGREVPFHKR